MHLNYTQSSSCAAEISSSAAEVSSHATDGMPKVFSPADGMPKVSSHAAEISKSFLRADGMPSL